MGIGRALVVGVEDVGFMPATPLPACKNDAGLMQKLLWNQGFYCKKLITKEATKGNIVHYIKQAASDSRPGDMFVFYFSGHGSTTPDRDGDETDGQDETLVAYDGHIIDDQLNKLWPRFRKDVRIFMMSDSCHSGTVYKMVNTKGMFTPHVASMPFKLNFGAKGFTKKSGKKSKSAGMKATLLHTGGCQDDKQSLAGTQFSDFTKAIYYSWNGGRFNGNYSDFVTLIYDKLMRMSGGQVPTLEGYGPNYRDFAAQKPFAIDPSKALKNNDPFNETSEADFADLPPLKPTLSNLGDSYGVEGCSDRDLLILALRRLADCLEAENEN